VVIASHQEDLSWVCELGKKKIPHIVYTRDKLDNKYNASPNKGKENAVFIKFIIDHYDKLPSMTAFVHGHKSSWHMNDVVPVLTNLRWNEHPYMDLNYKHWQSSHPQDLYGYALIKSEWNNLFLEFFGDMPPIFFHYCCGQFAVSKERILLRPKKFYQRAYDWIINEPVYSERAKLFEYTWSYIFGEPHNRKPYPNECYVIKCPERW